MAALMGLPTELLCHILEEVGGSHLRRGKGAAARLCLSRQWYAVAQPVYLTGLGTTHIKIYGHNLDDLETKYGISGLRPLMYKNTRSLRLRLLGHWWDSNVAATYDSEDEDGNSVDSDAHNEPPFDFKQPAGRKALETWRDEKLRPYLEALFDDLRNFSVLQSLSVEASSDPSYEDTDGPRWDYIYQSSIVHLLQNLPIMHDLSSLTLDLCGMHDSLCDEQPGVHLCALLATVLPQIEHVRVRLPSTCSSILKLPTTRPANVRLKTMILKLHLPISAQSNISRACGGAHLFRNSSFLYDHLVKQTPHFLQQLAAYRGQDVHSDPESHGMTGLRITFKDPQGPCVSTIDCLRMRYVFVSNSKSREVAHCIRNQYANLSSLALGPRRVLHLRGRRSSVLVRVRGG